MNGAEALLRTLAAGGVDVCFANPGTSEMHLVEAFDRVTEVRPVLALFEGVLSGALPWGLVGTGAGLAVCALIAGLPGLSFAVGVYLPLSTLAARLKLAGEQLEASLLVTVNV